MQKILLIQPFNNNKPLPYKKKNDKLKLFSKQSSAKINNQYKIVQKTSQAKLE